MREVTDIMQEYFSSDTLPFLSFCQMMKRYSGQLHIFENVADFCHFVT